MFKVIDKRDKVIRKIYAISDDRNRPNFLYYDYKQKEWKWGWSFDFVPFDEENEKSVFKKQKKKGIK